MDLGSIAGGLQEMRLMNTFTLSLLTFLYLADSSRIQSTFRSSVDPSIAGVECLPIFLLTWNVKDPDRRAPYDCT